MPDYKASTVVGSSYRRGHKMVFDNSLETTPSIRIDEEDIYLLEIDGKMQRIKKDAGNLQKVIFDYETLVTLRNPEDGSETEQQISYGAIYQILYSLYWHLAQERDAEMQVKAYAG